MNSIAVLISIPLVSTKYGFSCVLAAMGLSWTPHIVRVAINALKKAKRGYLNIVASEEAKLLDNK